MSNPFAYAFVGLALFGAGYFTSGVVESGRIARVSAALQAQLLDYNAETIAATKAEASRILAAVAERNPQREAQTTLVREIIKEVQLAPSTTDCLSSPGVSVALDRLRDLEATRPDRVAP